MKRIMFIAARKQAVQIHFSLKPLPLLSVFYTMNKNMFIRKCPFVLFIALFIITSFAFIIHEPDAANKKRVYALKKRVQKKVSTARKSKASRNRVRILSKTPYRGAIVLNAASGEVLFKDNADTMGYPASMVKMMDLLLILEGIDKGEIALQDKVVVSAEAARMGGSQVYLKEKAVHTVEDLLYALMLQSANDAAVALALHYKGSKEAFVELMNRRAEELGMKDTVFHSVHGLPPGRGQLPDVSTARDMARLGQKLVRHPGALKYTSMKKRLFRPDAPEPFIMRNHNHLVGSFEGCDGLKTGFFWAAGFSITATATQNGTRALVVIIGSVSSKIRDLKATKLLSESLARLEAERHMTASVGHGVLSIFNE
jgi:D-alanyl-D-alanine carboxypeptidase (penicillin-binding protein 5/6)